MKISYFDILKDEWHFLNEIINRVNIDFKSKFPIYLESIKKSLKQYIDREYESVDTDTLLSTNKMLKDHLEIARVSKDAILSLAECQETSEEKFSEAKDLHIIPFLRSLAFGRYESVKALTAILPRNEALHYAKKIVDQIISTDVSAKIGDPIVMEDIEKYLVGWTEDYDGEIFTAYILNEKQAGAKMYKCWASEVLKDVEDKEFLYIVTCNTDIPFFPAKYQNLRLTRTKTLLEGDPYCDFCFHDTRYAPDTPHPDEKFWEGLE